MTTIYRLEPRSHSCTALHCLPCPALSCCANVTGPRSQRTRRYDHAKTATPTSKCLFRGPYFPCLFGSDQMQREIQGPSKDSFSRSFSRGQQVLANSRSSGSGAVLGFSGARSKSSLDKRLLPTWLVRATHVSQTRCPFFCCLSVCLSPLIMQVPARAEQYEPNICTHQEAVCGVGAESPRCAVISQTTKARRANLPTAFISTPVSPFCARQLWPGHPLACSPIPTPTVNHTILSLAEHVHLLYSLTYNYNSPRFSSKTAIFYERLFYFSDGYLLFLKRPRER